MPAPRKNKNAVGNDGGRPTKYKPEYAEQAFRLCLLGLTDEELAKYFEVDPSTVSNWKNDHVEFLEAVIGGREKADGKVAEGLYKRACGYEFDEVTFERIVLDDTPVEELKDQENDDVKKDAYKKKVVTKHLPPDPGAAMNWLKNRQKTKWRDSTDVNVSGSFLEMLKKANQNESNQPE